MPYKKWCHLHNEKIKCEYPERKAQEIADEINVGYYTVVRRAKRLGSKKSDAFIHTGRNAGSTYIEKWKMESTKKYMMAHFPHTSNAELAMLFCVDIKTVRRWAQWLGLKKSKEYMKTVYEKSKGGRKFYSQEYLDARNRRIEEIYPTGSESDLTQLATELGISRSTLTNIARKLGLKRLQRATRKRKYDDEFIARLAAFYPTHSITECVEHFGINAGMLNFLAHKHGIKKTKEHRSRIARENRNKA